MFGESYTTDTLFMSIFLCFYSCSVSDAVGARGDILLCKVYDPPVILLSARRNEVYGQQSIATHGIDMCKLWSASLSASRLTQNCK